MSATAAPADAEGKTQVFLEGDDEIRGQKFVCLSFLTPNRGLMRNKEHFFISKFLEFYAMDYKVRATESFIMEQLREVQSKLSDVELELSNTTAETFNAAAITEKVSKAREDLSRKTAADLEAHVKANLSSFGESDIKESYERYMLVHRAKLEEEFHKANDFQTTMHGLKVRGAYATNEQAVARAKALHKKDPYHNVYVAEVGEWLPWDPEPAEVQDQEYSNDQLNKLMTAYRENAAKKDAFFEEEKRQRMSEAASAAAAAKKAATFGEKGREVEAADMARELMEGVDADLAIARKAAASAEAAAAGGDSATITYA